MIDYEHSSFKYVAMVDSGYFKNIFIFALL